MNTNTKTVISNLNTKNCAKSEQKENATQTTYWMCHWTYIIFKTSWRRCKKLDKQITSSLLHCATQLQLKEREMLMFHKSEEEKLHNLMEKPLHERDLNEVTQYNEYITASGNWLRLKRCSQKQKVFTWHSRLGCSNKNICRTHYLLPR